MAKTKMKEVFIHSLEKRDLQFFIELLSERLKHTEFALAYREGKVRIRLFGDREEVAQSAQLTKELGKMFAQSMHPDSDGYYIHSLEIMQHVSQRIISLDSISSVLNYSGFPSSVEEKKLITKAPLDKVKEVLEALYPIVRELPREVRSQAMKKILLTVSYCTKIPSEFIIRKGLEGGYFKENRERYIVIAKPPEECIEGLLKELNSDEVREEYEQELKKRNKFTKIIFNGDF